MSTFIVHFLIPPLMILATGYFRARHVWAFVWVGIVSDLDYIGHILYVNGIVPIETHRAILHNLWILFALAGAGYYSFRRFRPANAGVPGGALHAFAQTRAGAGWMLASYYYFSHLLLDSFQGGIVPLWPLLDHNVYYSFDLLVNTTTQEITPKAEAQAVPGGAPTLSPVYPWLNSEQFAFILLLATSLGLTAWYRRAGPRIRIVKAVLLKPPPAPGEGPSAKVPPEKAA